MEQKPLKKAQLEEENPTIPENKKNPTSFKKPLNFLIILFVILAIGFFGFYSWNSKPKTQPKITQSAQNVQKPNIVLPKNNILVYSRCYGGDRQPSSCNLYTSNIQEPKEQLIYVYNFPKVNQTDYQGGFFVNLLGIADKKVLYEKAYWEYTQKKNKDGSGPIKTTTIYGIINLENGQNTEVLRRSEEKDPYVISTFVDSLNNKFYYSTETSPENNPTITMYDLKENKSVTWKNLNNSFQIIGANEKQLFLSTVARVGASTTWADSLNIADGSIIKVEKPIDNPVFDIAGNHVAYVEKEKVGTDFYNIKLIVSNVDGSDKKEIYAKNNLKDDYWCPELSIGNYFFNSYGDELGFNTQMCSSKEQHSYISVLEIRKPAPNQKGITLLAPDNPNVYKNLIEITPSNQEFQWVDFITYGTPLDGNQNEGILYQSNGVWYLLGDWGIYANDNKLNLSDNSKPILLGANKLFIIDR